MSPAMQTTILILIAVHTAYGLKCWQQTKIDGKETIPPTETDCTGIQKACGVRNTTINKIRTITKFCSPTMETCKAMCAGQLTENKVCSIECCDTKLCNASNFNMASVTTVVISIFAIFFVITL